LQYRNPWGQVRIGRILEDLDSLAGFVAYEHWWVAWLGGWLSVAGGLYWLHKQAGQLPAHPSTHCSMYAGHVHATVWQCQQLRTWSLSTAVWLCSDDGDAATRPPLLVTATVEAIQLRGSSLTLEQDMEASGRPSVQYNA
jgi:hypothetical protein